MTTENLLETPACTLPTAQRPLRLAEFETVFSTMVRGRRRPSPTTLSLDLEPGAEVAARVADLMARESRCCSFFTFTLTAGGGELRLDVTVPPERAGILDALAGA
jgi:hypothetical protein